MAQGQRALFEETANSGMVDTAATGEVLGAVCDREGVFLLMAER